MAAEEIIGKRFPFGPLAVTPKSILAFGLGVNDETPHHTDTEAADFCAHPFFAAQALIPGTGAVMFHPKAGINIGRIVHGGIDLNFRRPILPGSDLSCEAALEAVDEKATGTLLSIGFRVFDGEGDVVDGVSRYFVRGKKKEGASASTAASDSDDPASGPSRFEVEGPTTSDQSILYAEGSGDRFPIHTSDDYARKVGLPGMILHGMCTLALSVSALVKRQAEGDTSRLEYASCKFRKMVLPGETLRVVGGRDASGDWAFETFNQRGEAAITEGVVRLR